MLGIFKQKNSIQNHSRKQSSNRHQPGTTNRTREAVHIKQQLMHSISSDARKYLTPVQLKICNSRSYIFSSPFQLKNSFSHRPPAGVSCFTNYLPICNEKPFK